MDFKSFVKKALLTALTLAVCIPVVLMVMNANAATEPSVDVKIEFLDSENSTVVLSEAHPGDRVMIRVTVVPKTKDGDSPQEYSVDGIPNAQGFVESDIQFDKNGDGTVYFAEATVPEQGGFPYCSFQLTSATVSGQMVSPPSEMPSASLRIPEFAGSSTGDSSGDSSSGGDSSSSSGDSGSSGDASASAGSSDSAPAAGGGAAAPAVSGGAGGNAGASTVSGVYTATSVNSVAITTPVASVATAAGLSEADIAAGTNVRTYVCDSRDREMKDALKTVAEASGRRVMAYISVDLYTITKAGVVTNVRNTAAPVAMTFGLPGSLANAGHAYSVMCMNPDGTTAIFEDVDTNNATITINATAFGTYAIVINP